MGVFLLAEDAALLLRKEHPRYFIDRGMLSIEGISIIAAEFCLVLHCRACLRRNSPPIKIQREVVAPMPQIIGSQRAFASAAEGRPAEKDTEAARGLETLPPTTEQYKAARAFEARFEGWRCVPGVVS